MNRKLIIIILLISNIAYSQANVDFKFYDSCVDSIINVEYSLIKLEDFSLAGSNYDNDSIPKIELGVYIVDIAVPDGENYKNFNFTKDFTEDKTYLDTIEIPKIMRKYTSVLHYPKDLGFFKCDEICDGYLADYYKNGEIRMEGDFKNGFPKKEIKKYNKNGELIEIEVYDNKGIYKKSKYPDYEKFVKSN